MGKQPAIIELNGQKYDALTGKRIASAPSQSPQRVVSDITPQPRAVRHHTASTKVHKKVDHSHTLMRHAVKKPVAQAVATAQEAPAEVVATESVPVTLKHSHAHTPKHAHHVKRSPHITRFGDITPVTPEPVTAKVEAPKQLDVSSAPVKHHAPHQEKVTSHTASAEELIQKGLRTAKNPAKSTSHSRVKLRHRAAKRLNVSHKVINFAASGAAVLLLFGFFAYQNIPNLAVRYAGMKAGVSATLPGYHPSAFNVSSDVQYSPGQVAVTYQSNTDDRKYTVTQKNTDWSNNELESFMTTQGGKAPQSYADPNGTIYIQTSTDKVTASTVENGVLKNVSGDASLNTDQVIKIVQSM